MHVAESTTTVQGAVAGTTTIAPANPTDTFTVTITTTPNLTTRTTTGPVIGTTTLTSSQSGDPSTVVVTELPPLQTLNCDPNGYLIRDGNTLVRVNITSGASTIVSTTVGVGLSNGASVRGAVNAMGYNVLNNLLYGIWKDTTNSANNRIIAIGGDGSWQLVGNSVSSSASSFNVGDIDTSGNYWISQAGGVWQQVDMRPTSATFLQTIANGDSSASRTTAATAGGSPIDWTFLPSRPGFLYGVASTASATQAQLIRWSTTTHTWALVSNLGNLAGTNSFGALYAAGSGILYGGENPSGTIWQFNVAGGAAVRVSTGPTATSNDGARCAFAAEPQA